MSLLSATRSRDDDVTIVTDTESEEEIFNDRSRLLSDNDEASASPGKRWKPGGANQNAPSPVPANSIRQTLSRMKRSFSELKENVSQELTWKRGRGSNSVTDSTAKLPGNSRISYKESVKNDSPDSGCGDASVVDSCDDERNTMNSQYVREKRKSIHRMVTIICLLVFLLGLSFPVAFSLAFLVNVYQFSLQCALFILFVSSSAVASLLVPAWSHKLGIRLPGILAFVSGVLLTTTKFFGANVLLIPVAVVSGGAYGLALVTFSYFITVLGVNYSQITGNDAAFFIYIGNGLMTLAEMCSYLLSACLLMAFKPYRSTLMPRSAPLFNNSCGASYPTTNISTHFIVFETSAIAERDAATHFRTQALLGLLLGCSLGGALLAWQWLPRDSSRSALIRTRSDVTDAGKDSVCDAPACFGGAEKSTKKDSGSVNGVLRTLLSAVSLLVAPLLVYSGLQRYFMFTVYIMRFPACGLSVRRALPLTLAAAGGAALGGPAAALLAGRGGGLRVTLPALLTQLALLVTMAATPQLATRPPALHATLMALWGVADGALLTTAKGMSATLLPSNAHTQAAITWWWVLCGQLLGVIMVVAHTPTLPFLLTTLILLLVAMATIIVHEVRMRLEEQTARVRAQESRGVPVLNEPLWLPHVNPVRVSTENTRALFTRLPGGANGFQQS